MPVLRTLKTYRPRRGAKRHIRLYRAWQNMNARVKGTTHDGAGGTRWKGLEIGWKCWEEFRWWALENGYSKVYNSLDRIDSSKGYTPDNCQWLTRAENSVKAMELRWGT